MRRVLRAVLPIALVILISCSEGKQPNQSSVQEIPVVEAMSRDVPRSFEFVGQLYGFQDIPIRARVEGYLEGVHFEEGGRVKKGQLLYTIDSQPFRAEVAAQESRVAEAKTVLTNAENELARYEPLVEINAVSKSDYDAVLARKDAATAAYEAAKSNLELAQINLSYTRIRAPIDGIIGKTQARAGEFVGRNPNPVILNTISKVNEMRVEFFLTESQYLTMARYYEQNDADTVKKASGRINLELVLSDGSVYENKGRIDFIDRNINAMTGTILVQGTFPNPNEILRPGMFSKVRIQGSQRENAILIPMRCIIELQGEYSVFVVDDSNVVQSRQVNIGEKIGDLMLITDGLQAGEKVVIDALQKVGSGMEVAPKEIEFNSKAS